MSRTAHIVHARVIPVDACRMELRVLIDVCSDGQDTAVCEVPVARASAAFVPPSSALSTQKQRLRCARKRKRHSAVQASAPPPMLDAFAVMMKRRRVAIAGEELEAAELLSQRPRCDTSSSGSE